MAAHVRKQIRDAAATTLTGLTTTASRVFESRTHELQDTDLPGLRIYTREETISSGTFEAGEVRERELELMVECCSKKSSGLDDELDAMVKEVEVALDAAQTLGGAKSAQLRHIAIDMEGEAEKEIGVARMTFAVSYYTAQGAPDVAL